MIFPVNIGAKVRNINDMVPRKKWVCFVLSWTWTWNLYNKQLSIALHLTWKLRVLYILFG